MKGFRIALISMALAGCAELPINTSPVKSDFERALSYARRDVDAGNYWAADRLLEEFVRTHPNTREAKEIAFWKAAYMLDPANNLGSLSGGIAALDNYLAADTSGWYTHEAIVLRRTAAVAQGISGRTTRSVADSTGTGSATVVTDTVVAVKRTRDEEIVALKDQLAKTKEELAKVSAELDRIKKRLANPSN